MPRPRGEAGPTGAELEARRKGKTPPKPPKPQPAAKGPPKYEAPKEVAGPYRSQSSVPKIRKAATKSEHRKIRNENPQYRNQQVYQGETKPRTPHEHKVARRGKAVRRILKGVPGVGKGSTPYQSIKHTSIIRESQLKGIEQSLSKAHKKLATSKLDPKTRKEVRSGIAALSAEKHRLLGRKHKGEIYTINKFLGHETKQVRKLQRAAKELANGQTVFGKNHHKQLKAIHHALHIHQRIAHKLGQTARQQAKKAEAEFAKSERRNAKAAKLYEEGKDIPHIEGSVSRKTHRKRLESIRQGPLGLKSPFALTPQEPKYQGKGPLYYVPKQGIRHHAIGGEVTLGGGLYTASEVRSLGHQAHYIKHVEPTESSVAITAANIGAMALAPEAKALQLVAKGVEAARATEAGAAAARVYEGFKGSKAVEALTRLRGGDAVFKNAKLAVESRKAEKALIESNGARMTTKGLTPVYRAGKNITKALTDLKGVSTATKIKFATLMRSRTGEALEQAAKDTRAIAGAGSPESVRASEARQALLKLTDKLRPGSQAIALRAKRGAIKLLPPTAVLGGLSATNSDWRTATIRDTHDLIVGFIPSTYQMLTASGDALMYGFTGGGHGSLARVQAIYHGMKETDPLALALQGRWHEAYKAFKERPVSGTIELGGAYTAVGKGLGAFGRALPDSFAPNLGAVKGRSALETIGNIKSYRTYSPNIITKQFQILGDKIPAAVLRNAEPRLKGGTVDYGSFVKNVVAKNEGHKFLVRMEHSADEMFALGQLSQRSNRADAEKKVGEIGRYVAHEGKHAPHALWLGATKIMRKPETAIEDVRAFKDKIEADIKKNNREGTVHPVYEAQRETLDILESLLARPKLLTSNRVWEGVKQFKELEDQHQAELVASGALHPDAKAYAPWIPYAVHHMGAKWDEKNGHFIWKPEGPIKVEKVKTPKNKGGSGRIPFLYDRATHRIYLGKEGDWHEQIYIAKKAEPSRQELVQGEVNMQVPDEPVFHMDHGEGKSFGEKTPVSDQTRNDVLKSLRSATGKDIRTLDEWNSVNIPRLKQAIPKHEKEIEHNTQNVTLAKANVKKLEAERAITEDQHLPELEKNIERAKQFEKEAASRIKTAKGAIAEIQRKIKEAAKAKEKPTPAGWTKLELQHILDHAKSAGVSEPAMVTTRLLDGSHARQLNLLTLPSAENYAATGEAIANGTADISFASLARQSVLSRTIIDKRRFYVAALDRMALRSPGNTHPVYFTSRKEALDWRDSYLGNHLGAHLEPVNLNEFIGRMSELSKTDLNHMIGGNKAENLYADMNKILHRALLESAGPEGKFVLVPTRMIDRLNQHAKYEYNVGKVIRRINREFKGSVLAFSPKWHFGNIADMAMRLFFEGAGYKSAIDGRNLLNHVKQVDEQAYNDLLTIIGGGHLAHASESLGDFTNVDRNMFNAYQSAQYRALGSVLRVGPEGLRKAYRGGQRGSFAIAQNIERHLRTMAVGKAARKEAERLGLKLNKVFSMNPDVIKELAQGIKQDSNVQARYGKLVNGVMGDYTTMSPEFRAAMLTYAPFLLWARASTRWVLALPAESPIRVSMIASINRLNEPERRRLGLSKFKPTKEGEETLPEYMLGSIPSLSGSFPKGKEAEGVFRTNAYTSFGPLVDFSGMMNFMLPQVKNVIDAYSGLDWTGKEIVNPNGTPLNDTQRVGVALQSALETYVALTGIAHQLVAQGDPSASFTLFKFDKNPLAGIKQRKTMMVPGGGIHFGEDVPKETTKYPYKLSATEGILAKTFLPTYKGPNYAVKQRHENAKYEREKHEVKGETSVNKFFGVRPKKKKRTKSELPSPTEWLSE